MINVPARPDGSKRRCIAQAQHIGMTAINNGLSKELLAMQTNALRNALRHQEVEAGLESEPAFGATLLGVAVKHGMVRAGD